MKQVPERRIRILHVVQTLGTGGLENGVVNLANAIDRERFQLDVLCLRGLGPLRARLNPGVRVCPPGKPDSGIGAAFRLILATCRGYDVLHTHGWATLLPGYLAGRLGRVPLIVNGEHGTLYFETLRRRVAQRLLLRLVDCNCAVSADLRNELVRRFGTPPERIRPIVNGVDTERFRPDAALRLRARNELGIGGEEIVIGTVGRLHEVKDYPTLVRAFAEIADRHPRTRLLFAGDGEQAAELEAIAPRLVESRRIRFLGNRGDVPALMNAMDVFALTSLREGLSNTLLEAQACGKPVLATRTGGNGEIVADGVTGRLFPVGDTAALARLLEELIGDDAERARLGQNARAQVVAERSIGRMTREYEALYAELAHKRIADFTRASKRAAGGGNEAA